MMHKDIQELYKLFLMDPGWFLVDARNLNGTYEFHFAASAAGPFHKIILGEIQ